MTRRVLHVVPTYLPAWRYGGPIHSVHGLCKALVRRGLDVHVFTTDMDIDGYSDVPLRRAVDVDGVKVWYFPSRRLKRLFYAPSMDTALREQVSGFDVVHLHAVFLWPIWAASRRAERAGVPYVVTPRGMLVEDLIRRKGRWVKRAWIHWIGRRLLARASAIHVTSETEVQDLRRLGLDLAPFLLSPNGLDLPPEEAAAAARATQPAEIVYLGRINWKKGLDRLIPALRHVPGATLTIAGNDDEHYTPQLERQVAEQGLDARVRFVGPVQGRAKWDLLRRATVLALPSYSENFGMVVLEAMAVGCPVAVSPEVGLASTVGESESGIVASGEPEVFGGALRAMLEDPERLAAMGRNGRRTILERFTWDGIAEGVQRAYDGMAQGSSHST